MVRQSLYVADIENQNLVHPQDVVKMDEQQNPDELNLDAVLTFLDVARHFLHFLADVQADVEQRHPLNHLLKRDYFQDVVDAEPRHLLRTDYFLDGELALSRLQNFLLRVEQLVQLE